MYYDDNNVIVPNLNNSITAAKWIYAVVSGNSRTSAVRRLRRFPKHPTKSVDMAAIPPKQHRTTAAAVTPGLRLITEIVLFETLATRALEELSKDAKDINEP
jgi:hypothetical protein